MKKRLVLMAALLLALAGIALFYWYVQPNEQAQLTEEDVYRARLKLRGGATSDVSQASAPESLDPKRPIRLAVGSLGFTEESKTRQLGDLVTAELTRASGFELVDRQSLDKVLAELNLGSAGLVRAKDAVRAGGLMRVDWFLLATIAASQGTNTMIARVVDAHTGIMRDIEVFAPAEPTPRLATQLAGFVQSCRRTSTARKPRTYLAIGSFEDLSINNRLADLVPRLRAYLTAGYQRSDVTLLERELVGTLLNEVYLDLAGLTDAAALEQSSRMQSAFWVIEGAINSYEGAAAQAEINFNINRIFGKTSRTFVRGQPDDSLFHRVKESIDAELNKPQPFFAPTRNSEIRLQLAIGKELFESVNDSFRQPLVMTPSPYVSDERLEHRRRNLQEIMRAYETVLLLDPENREARVYLAACLRHPAIDRPGGAREHYRSVINSTVEDRWSSVARAALLQSFYWAPRDEQLTWLQTAGQTPTGNPRADEFYRSNATVVARAVAIQAGVGPGAAKAAEARLFDEVRQCSEHLKTKSSVFPNFNAVSRFADTFGTNTTALASRIRELLPELQAQTPDLGPHLLAQALAFQLSTNTPLLSEFEASFKGAVNYPERVPNSRLYFAELPRVHTWCLDQRHHRLGAAILEARLALSRTNRYLSFTRQDRVKLGYDYLGLERWKDALNVFIALSNCPVNMGQSGPWGHYMIPVAPYREVALCRQKLDLPPATDPKQFEFGNPQACLHYGADGARDRYWNLRKPWTFAPASAGLWIAGEDQLISVDWDCRTNFTVTIPDTAGSPVTRIAVTSSNVWVGTEGEGLLQFDSSTKQFRRFTEADGLLLNYVSGLHATKDTLWVGFSDPSDRRKGGLGCIDLCTLKAQAFTPSIEPGRPPTRSIGSGPAEGTKVASGSMVALTADSTGAPWCATWNWGVSVYHFVPGSKAWKSYEGVGRATALGVLDKRLFLGENWSSDDYENDHQRGLGVLVGNLEDGSWKRLPGVSHLPTGAVHALTTDGNDVWLGGMGFVARLNPETGDVRAHSYVWGDSVQGLHVAGGYLWAQFNRHLYRVPLNSIPK